MEVQLRLGDLGTLIKIQEKFKPNDKFSKLQELISKEVGIEKVNLIIIDEKGVDYSSCSSDDTIFMKMKHDQPITLYVYDETRTDSNIVKYFEEEKTKQANSNFISINNGLIETDIEERFNFKPIYAAASLIPDVDLTTIQNFEQSFFNDYQLLKQAYKKFKQSISAGFKSLKDVDQQVISFDLLKKSVKSTYDMLQSQKNSLGNSFQKVYSQNLEILKVYRDALEDLKKYELHPVLVKENKKYLSDIYYDETAMNKWRDTCAKSNEGLKTKMDKIDKDFKAAKDRVFDNPRSTDASLDEQRQRDLLKQIENMMQDTEPLIISIISTVLENLKEMHRHLNKLCGSDPSREDIKAASQYLTNIEQFRRKIKEHSDLANNMEEHCKQLDKILDQIQLLRQRNAQAIQKVNQKDVNSRKEFKKYNVTHEVIRYLNETLVRIEKDFQYLKQPSELPRTYERSLVEVQRRRRFRKLVEQEVGRIQKFIHKEREFRSMFRNEFNRKKPTDFLPQLEESTPVLKLEGGNNDLDLPEIEDLSLSEFDDFFNLLGDGGSSSQNKNQRQNDELQGKYNTLLKEINMLKEEHKSNVRDLTTKAEQAECSLQQMTQKDKENLNKLNLKERDIQKMKEEIEKFQKTLKDSSLKFSEAQRMTEEALARKQKEFEALAKSKNCKGCVICSEEIKEKNQQVLVKELNDKLFEKNNRINNLEEQVRKSATLINQVCMHNFSFLRQKTQDFYKALEKTKQQYECRLMEVEDQLGLEKKRCEDLIKTRVAILEEKYQRGLTKEQELTKKLKEANFQQQSMEKELKSHITKIKEHQAQIAKLHNENQKLNSERKHIEDESKKQVNKLEVQILEEKNRLQELKNQLRKGEDSDKKISQLKDQYEDQIMEKLNHIKKITTIRDELQQKVQEMNEEKTKLEDKYKKDQNILTKQLKELKENYEREIREKNEKILSLNNMLNEHFDKEKDLSQQKEVSAEQYEKKKKELAIKIKDLQEVSHILSKRDQEIQQQKFEVERIKKENETLQSQLMKLQRLNGGQNNKENQSTKDSEIEKMRDYINSLEKEFKQKTQRHEDFESTINRIREYTTVTCNIKDNEKWESNLAKVLFQNSHECINFMSADEGIRVLFMPHSPGIYIALVLKNLEEIIQENLLKDKDMNSLLEQSSIKNSQHVPAVKRLNIKNNLFLDIKSMSKNLQTILENYQMIVIAKIKSVSQHTVSEQYNPYELEPSESFFQCQIEKLEHIVGFESDDFCITDYVCK